MDPAACRVIYIDDRFNTERWISRDGLAPTTPQRASSQTEFSELPPDLQANVNAFLSVFNQVFVCQSGRSFSTKLSELHDQVRPDCTPIIACFDVGSESKHFQTLQSKRRFSPMVDSGPPSPNLLRREITFSSESDESYGLQLLSRIASDLQVEDGTQLIIPVAIVQPKRKDSYDHAMATHSLPSIARAPYGPELAPVQLEDKSDAVDPDLMLQCLDAGALDVVKSPLDKAGIMGLTVHAYRIYKHAKKEQAGFMAQARRGRKQSWVGMEEEKPYAYLREAMVKKLLKGICEPTTVIEDYQHRDLYVEDSRKEVIAREVGTWGFCGHDFSEDELVYAGYYMLNHALQMPELEKWHLSEAELLHFMQGCRIAYNSFVLYHNFRHAVDVLQSLFHFLVRIGTVPPYPKGSKPLPLSEEKSPIASLLGPFEALTLLISAIGHDVGHPGVNNMFLVKLNAPLAQLYNDQSVLEAFHCAAYSQILRRHWPVAFQDKSIRKLMISSILATDMGVHSDYMQQLGNLQEKIHESKSTDTWSPKDVDAFRTLTCGLLIKCADISNVARPWAIAEKWTHLLQREFAHQGEMEQAVGMETTLFGGPPELGNMLKLANGQIGFMTIFAHPLFSNVADIIPAMSFAADEILTNKGVWFTRAEHEKKAQALRKGTGIRTSGAISPRSLSPSSRVRKPVGEDPKSSSNLVPSPLHSHSELNSDSDSKHKAASIGHAVSGNTTPQQDSPRTSRLGVENGKTNETPQSNDSANNPRGDTKVQDYQPQKSSNLAENKPLNNEVSSTSKFTDSESELREQSLGDPRRDTGVSMRAGSTAIPVPEGSNLENGTNPPNALDKFTFATSDKEEPVRTYDPQQHYPALHASARASAPAANGDPQKTQKSEVQEARQTTSAQSDSNTTSTNQRVGFGEAQSTPSHSPEGTSYTSDRSDEMQRRQEPSGRGSTFESKRNRASSAPMQMDSPTLETSCSLDSTKEEYREGSKNDIRTADWPNGDAQDRKGSTKSVGRKRSKIKMGLAFWKKKSSDKSVIEDEQQQSAEVQSPQEAYSSR